METGKQVFVLYLPTCLPVYLFLILLALPSDNLERLRQNLKIYIVKIAAKTCVNLAICMDIHRQVGGEFECFEFAHLDLFEAHVSAFEKFGHKTKHGGARNFLDGEKFHFAVIVFRVGRKHETAAFARAVA
jgi:hypothetical protein